MALNLSPNDVVASDLPTDKTDLQVVLLQNGRFMAVPIGAAIIGQLATLESLTPTDGAFIVGDGDKFITEDGATALASLGLPKSSGTWSPSYRGETTPGTYTVTITNANYYRIGKFVHVSGLIALTTVTVAGTGNANITNLPFSANAANFVGKLSGNSSSYVGIIPDSVRTVSGQTYLRLTHYNSATGAASTSAAGFAAGTAFGFSVCYTTDDA